MTGMSKVFGRSCVALALAATVFGCGKNPLSSQDRYTQLVTEAWSYYGTGDYADAVTTFQQASAVGVPDSDAELGVGWAMLREGRLTEANAALATITVSDTARYRHAQAGIALIQDGLRAFDRSIIAARAVLARDSNYVFPRDPRVDWREMCYLLAKDYLTLSTSADPTLANTLTYLARIDTGPALVATDSTTWTANGVAYGTLAEAVAKRLESLQHTIADPPPS